MSIETTTKRAAAADAEEQWAGHRRLCASCGSAVRGRGRPPLCAAGKAIRDIARELRADARESARLDKQPGPGDVPLFGPGSSDG